jgi:hypothetical protein
MWLIQTRSIEFTYKSAFKDLVYIVKTHGILNLWRGNLMNLLRVCPHAAIVRGVLSRTTRPLTS